MAHKAIPKKPAARKAPMAAKAPVAKKSVKPAASARTGSAAKPASRSKTPATATRKAAPSKPAPAKAAPPPLSPRATAKPTPRPVAAPVPHPVAEVKPAAPVKAGSLTVASPVASPAASPAPATPAPPPRKAGRGAAKYAVAQAPMPLPPPTSRFADRFAPPRPPTRQMNNLEVDQPRHARKSDPKLANAWKSKAGHDLTEDEVLAMPESEYMNEKQLEFFRTRLQQLKDDLLSNAGETTEHLREDTSIVPDPADRATIEEEHALELRTRDRERKLLKKISQSLARIDSGDYGFCDETGEPIGLGRLIARPTATLSLEAQQRRELKQKMFGD